MLILFLPTLNSVPRSIFGCPQMLESCMYFFLLFLNNAEAPISQPLCMSVDSVGGSPSSCRKARQRQAEHVGCTQKGLQSVSSNIRGRSTFQLVFHHVSSNIDEGRSLIGVGLFNSRAEMIYVTVTEQYICYAYVLHTWTMIRSRRACELFLLLLHLKICNVTHTQQAISDISDMSDMSTPPPPRRNFTVCLAVTTWTPLFLKK